METRYTVRQTVEMTGVKSYVLRYWEEELELQIHRNELGHRYYTGYDIQLFLNIKELKRRGLQLRAIKKLIPQITASMSGWGSVAGRYYRGYIGRGTEQCKGRCRYKTEYRYRQSGNMQ